MLALRGGFLFDPGGKRQEADLGVGVTISDLLQLDYAYIKDVQLLGNQPAGVREGQHLRLAGQGTPGFDGGPAGDLYLEIGFHPHPLFRVDGRDVYLDLQVAPWEAALGDSVDVPMPDGSVTLSIPAGSAEGRKLRLKSKGIPGKTPGDLYVVLRIAMPREAGAAQQQAWRELAKAYGSGFDPRAAREGK